MSKAVKKKIRLLCAVNGDFYSHTARVLAIALRLREFPQFEIVFSGTGPNMLLARSNGFDVIETEHLMSDEVVAHSDANGIHWFDRPDRLAELFDSEVATFRQYQPDVCLRDNFRDPASVVSYLCEALDIMVAQSSQTDAYRFDFVPVNYGIAGAVDELKNLPELIRLARRKAYQPIYNKATEMGVPRAACKDFGTQADLYLLAESYAVSPVKPSNGNYRYTGPLWHLNPSQSPDWLARFSDSQQTKLLVTTGSTGITDFADFFAEFDSGAYTLAFTDEVPAPLLGGTPSMITSVLPHCDLVVSHGGLGTAYMALYAGKPSVVVYDQFERQSNARQLEKLGVGAGLDISCATARDIIDAAEALLTDPIVDSQLVKTQSLLLAEPEGTYLAAKHVVEACMDRFPQWRSDLEPVLVHLTDECRQNPIGAQKWVAELAGTDSSPACADQPQSK